MDNNNKEFLREMLLAITNLVQNGGLDASLHLSFAPNTFPPRAVVKVKGDPQHLHMLLGMAITENEDVRDALIRVVMSYMIANGMAQAVAVSPLWM